jgi:transcriptional regulator with XRE-family HTH domain
MESVELLTELIAEGKKQGFTQSKLATAAGIHPVTLSKAIGTGRYEIATLQSLCRVLNMKVILTRNNDISEGLRKGDLF